MHAREKEHLRCTQKKLVKQETDKNSLETHTDNLRRLILYDGDLASLICHNRYDKSMINVVTTNPRYQ